jgi:hypothetical protein
VCGAVPCVELKLYGTNTCIQYHNYIRFKYVPDRQGLVDS